MPLLDTNVAHIDVTVHGAQRYWCRKAVDDLVIPLVEYGHSPAAIGKAREGERPIGVTLGESDIRGIRIAEAHVALGESKGVARTTAVESLVRRTAHACAGNLARDRILAAGRRCQSSADSRQAAVDDFWVGKADDVMVSGRPELLEVAWP